ncbi:Asparagine synthetase [glutamine-hydrolyzing] 1 [Kiritimatiella glycovorans]|uniref:asparagine synthase (glutamine-hydrolyzing) n=2 Tax=Kiritimatiella glycovorans TaxID=1307763 RepID=A0A0G3EN12_9BACT|nr:asparagine synthase (glutamine-hydrolyzing) [Kiritimatiella glycovorans]AKJ65529.1 Asparagine synthetase [glutamine-hydrolyzing] 1 [Kiritimatiella glycovorans]
MCGFAGIVKEEGAIDADVLKRMRDTMVSRGPDDEGLAVWEARAPRDAKGFSLGLAHRRLSIVDLSSAARQPMSNEDGSIWIVYNGEVYGHEEARRELKSKGHVFRSRCDTETILHLYEEFGIEGLLDRLRGMFAFAIYDRDQDALYLARDRAGQKPLYYSPQGGRGLCFASEIKALLASGAIDREQIDETGFAQFWTYGYAVGERTFYAQVRELPPAHYACWRSGRLEVRRYWRVRFEGQVSGSRKLDELADEFEARLTESIRMRLMSDVPLGIFLSGGIDSTLIAAVAAKRLGHAIPCYTIGFDDPAYDESERASAVARYLGLRHHVLRLRADRMGEFETIARYYDEPFGDPSAVPEHYVCGLARENITVALTGDGADELFAGYRTYPRFLALWGEAEDRAKMAPHAKSLNPAVRLRMKCVAPENRCHKFSQLIPDRHFFRIMSAGPALRCFRARREERDASMADYVRGSLLSRLQQLDFNHYLPGEVLKKVDRAGMAHSLECRSPFLDHEMIEFAARLPRSARLSPGGAGKVLLRRVLERHVPRELWDRSKQGFIPPFQQWCVNDNAARMQERWRSLSSPLVRRSAAGLVFAETGGRRRLAWNAFSALQFLK